ncbi:hypothetical protein EDB85DRAFT_2286211 [Lactarius pseudohatsudake]|nr:hypothetical protein EDB85DRAFT_2286211 [Lactarius pseudohatsudake]
MASSRNFRSASSFSKKRTIDMKTAILRSAGVTTDLDAGRLAFAESLEPGRVRALRVAPDDAPEALAARVVEAMGGTEPDVALECTGA